LAGVPNVNELCNPFDEDEEEEEDVEVPSEITFEMEDEDDERPLEWNSR